MLAPFLRIPQAGRARSARTRFEKPSGPSASATASAESGYIRWVWEVAAVVFIRRTEKRTKSDGIRGKAWKREREREREEGGTMTEEGKN